MLLAKEQHRSRLQLLHAVSYMGIYIGYRSKTQYRVHWPDKNRFRWPTNVIFVEDRRGMELLSKNLLPAHERRS